MQRFVDVDIRLMACTCQFNGYVHFSFLLTLLNLEYRPKCTSAYALPTAVLVILSHRAELSRLGVGVLGAVLGVRIAEPT